MKYTRYTTKALFLAELNNTVKGIDVNLSARAGSWSYFLEDGTCIRCAGVIQMIASLNKELDAGLCEKTSRTAGGKSLLVGFLDKVAPKKVIEEVETPTEIKKTISTKKSPTKKVSKKNTE